MRVDLGKDRWAEIVDADDMPHATQVAVNKIIPMPDPTRPDVVLYTPEVLDRVRDAMLAHLITAWSFDQPLPDGDLDRIAFLPSSAYKALLDATQDHWQELGFTSRKASEESESSPGSSDATG